MKLIVLIVLMGGYAPLSWGLNAEDARHLLSRTGFTPSFLEIQPYLPLTRTEAINKRLAEVKTHSQQPLPAAFNLPYQLPNLKSKTRAEKKAFRQKIRRQMQQLQAWWLSEMLTTTSPMTENLTLFWHNHFVSSGRKVKMPALMAQQNKTLRLYAAGNFKTFLHAMIKDPALLMYLDNTKNKKDKPNENLARELMELFTLGEGHYTEQDVKQAVQALSGYGVKYRSGEFVFRKKQHNTGLKTIFGKTGDWDGDDLIDLILSRKQTALFITDKLWTRFITTPIPKKVAAKLSGNFYKNYQIKPLLKAILSQPAFWAQSNHGTQIKSPVQLVVGSFRQFELQKTKKMQTMGEKSYRFLINQTKRMGQNIFYPPNVKGWKTGNAWINTSTLLARQGFENRLMRGMQLKKQLVNINKTNQAWLSLLVAQPLQKHFKPIETENEKHLIKRILLDVRNQLQ